MINVGHRCHLNDKYCREGANPARHTDELPWDHRSQHNSHNGGCICQKGQEPLRLILITKILASMGRLPSGGKALS